MNQKQSFLERIEKVTVYKRGNERAPHKPLYLLQCIAAAQHGLARLQPFTQIEKTLREALIQFGLSTSSVSPQYPFWRLQNDGLAVVVPSGPYEFRKQASDPTKKSLVENDAHGGLIESDFDLLREDLDLQTLCTHTILDSHFPRSIHEDIIAFFNLRLSGARGNDEQTESEFRVRIMSAYDNACALSGFSVGYRRSFPGLEAAHICWLQAGGNDDVSNGIAMTTLHRKLFHLGLLTIDEQMKVVLCSELSDMSRPPSSVSKLMGKKISLPKNPKNWPNPEALSWHRKWVYKG